MPAIMQRLLAHGFSRNESKAVVEALEIARDDKRVKWRDEVIQQVNGCSLGPADFCDYADIALDAVLQVLVPRIESQLEIEFLQR